MKRKKQHAGFSLAEVLVAMFVIIVGIAGTTSVIWWGLMQEDAGKSIHEASNIGRIITENILASNPIPQAANGQPWPGADSGLNDAPDVRRPLNAPPNGVAASLFENNGRGLGEVASLGNIHSNLGRFTRNITVTRLAEPGSEDFNSDLALLTVRIYWPDTPMERSVVQQVVLPHGLEN